jgi:3-carboxy-cis,cis-muconate cycloisomerase
MLDAHLRDAETEALLGDAALVAAMVEVEVAVARVQSRLGLIDAGAGEEIASALAGFTPDLEAITAGLEEAAVPVAALVEQMRDHLGPALDSLVHLGATSQDIVDTALILQLGKALDMFEGRLRRLVAALMALAERHATTPMLARTRFQQALPTTFGLKVAGWLDPLVRHLIRLAQLRPRLLVVQLGGAAGTLAAMGEAGPRVMTGLAAELGLNTPAMPWHSQRDGLVELASWLALVTGTLGKLGTDVLLMAQNEVGELRQAAGGGSSTLPQKANPVLAEALVTLARQNATSLSAMAQAQLHAHERDGTAWQLEWLTLPGMVGSTAVALARSLLLVETLVVEPQRMRANLEASRGLVLAELLGFALACHMPREAAKHQLVEACREVEAGGGHLVDILRRNVDLPLDWEALADPTRHLGAAEALQARTLERARAVLATGASDVG